MIEEEAPLGPTGDTHHSHPIAHDKLAFIPNIADGHSAICKGGKATDSLDEADARFCGVKIKLEKVDVVMDDASGGGLETSEDWLKAVKEETSERLESEEFLQTASGDNAQISEPHPNTTCDEIFIPRIIIEDGHCTIFKTEMPMEDANDKPVEEPWTAINGNHSSTQTRSESFYCNVCNMMFCMETELVKHMVNHKGYNLCEICGKGSDSTNLCSHTRSTNLREKIHVCDICTKSFKSKKYLRAHVKTHSKEKPHSCDVCSKSFKTSDKLKVHKTRHSTEKPYLCDTCMKAFKNKADLASHVKTHSSEKPYSCVVCLKSFKNNSDLKKHRRRHLVEKPYCCDSCMKNFKNKSDLASHMKTHSSEKLYACEVCLKCFKTKSEQKLHVTRHSMEKSFCCEACTKTYKTKFELSRHMKTHSSEKPYACDFCSKSFQCKTRLKKHKARHPLEMVMILTGNAHK